MARKYSIFVNEHRIDIYENPEIGTLDGTFEPITAEDLHHSYLRLSDLKDGSERIAVYTANWKNLIKDSEATFKHIHAAGGLVFNKLKKTLWIKRMGKWDLPKGKIEAAENPEEAALREISEECGLELDQIKLVAPITQTFHIYELKGKPVLKTTWWYECLYLGHLIGSPQTEEDITEIKWMTLEEVEQIALLNTYGNIRLIAARFKP
jgi:8-oxo-dGTP pyrophosphatase MutT (NUDIX family)